jgi:hypothetical protein
MIVASDAHISLAGLPCRIKGLGQPGDFSIQYSTVNVDEVLLESQWAI